MTARELADKAREAANVHGLDPAGAAWELLRDMTISVPLAVAAQVLLIQESYAKTRDAFRARAGNQVLLAAIEILDGLAPS